MPSKLLLTSFTTWKTEQPSNSSDDLLEEIRDRQLFPDSLHFLRQIPVDFQLAPQQVIAQVEALRPDAIICCGMAETRDKLNLEAQAAIADQVMHTAFNLPDLMEGLTWTEVSYDAGNFVCNQLYYEMLHYLHRHNLSQPCLFVHVPILTAANRHWVVTDVQRILEKTLAFIEQPLSPAQV